MACSEGVQHMATALAAPEMKGPVKGVLWVHNAILRETSTFGEAEACDEKI